MGVKDKIKCPTGPEPINVEVMYPTSEELEPLEKPDAMAKVKRGNYLICRSPCILGWSCFGSRILG